MVCSFPRQSDSWVFDGLYRAGRVELELVPQGTIAERLRAAGAGIGAFYTPTGVGTPLAEGKETRVIDGRAYLLEYPLKGDVALVNLLTTPDSFMRLPSMIVARRGRPLGAIRPPTMVMTMGKSIFVVLETLFAWLFMTVVRSFCVVSILMMGG